MVLSGEGNASGVIQAGELYVSCDPVECGAELSEPDLALPKVEFLGFEILIALVYVLAQYRLYSERCCLVACCAEGVPQHCQVSPRYTHLGSLSIRSPTGGRGRDSRVRVKAWQELSRF